MHSGGLELTKLTCTRLEDNLIRHRGDRLCTPLGKNTYFDYTESAARCPVPDDLTHGLGI